MNNVAGISAVKAGDVTNRFSFYREYDVLSNQEAIRE